MSATGRGGWLVCGLDEAGLGPLLGPLAIGYTVLRIPRRGADPWKLLARRVSRDPRRDRDRLVVADSKKVFTRNRRGRRRLELTVLAFLAQIRADRRPPREARELLFGELRPPADILERHPWYARLAGLPREVDPGTAELSAALLARALESGSCALVDAGVRIVPSGELNLSYHETNNKATTLWSKTLEVLRHLWREHGALAPEVTVDLQGGRTHYGPLLARAFSDASVRLLRESRGYAAYELAERGACSRSSPRRRMRLAFVARGEESSFTVALASCLAKYARETVMDAFNAFFAEHQESLRPTAGYTSDARRWLSDAGRALSAAGIEDTVLLRER